MTVDNKLPSPETELAARIVRLKKEKGAVILAHYYTLPEVQRIADFTGDSLALSQQAARTDARIILFAGVHFMAETAKILSPDKKVLLPEPAAGCSLADSCRAEDFAEFLKSYPGHTVVSYVNTSVGVKALTDICCTSSNAVDVIRSLPSDAKIVFAPDRNLGNYIRGVTGRDMVVWDGACGVHEEFSLEKILELKKKYPEAKVLAHPECKKTVLLDVHGIQGQQGRIPAVRFDRSGRYVHRRDGSGHIVPDAKGESREDFHSGSSRRRFLRMQQLRVHENGHARQDIPCVARRVARSRSRRGDPAEGRGLDPTHARDRQVSGAEEDQPYMTQLI